MFNPLSLLKLNPADILTSVWFKLATYVVAAAAGAALCVYVYARPEIEKRELVIAQQKAASAKNQADFLRQAAEAKQESDREQRAIEAAAEVAKQRTDAAAADLAAGIR